MIKRHYTGKTRRSLNTIWNAAGSYDFDPPFQAFFPNGEPDLYYDMVIGFTAKWFSIERVTDFFESYQGKSKRDEYDALLWLGIENCVYEKEVKERPILASLRKQRAEKFYESMGLLSRQQMMLLSTPVYEQMELRSAEVLGKKAPLLSPRARAMGKDILFSGDLDEDGLLDAMRNFLITHFHYDCVTHPAYAKAQPTGLAKAFYKKVLKKEHQQTDSLFVRNLDQAGNPQAHLLDHTGTTVRKSTDEKDTAYIEAIFGPSLYSPKEMRILENDLCSGVDANCRLYLAGSENTGQIDPAGTKPIGNNDDSGANGQTDGANDTRRALSAKEQQQLDDIRAQAKHNQTWLAQHMFAVQENIRKLSSETDTIFSSFKRQLPTIAKAGQLMPARAYRLAALQDPMVFEKPGADAEYEVQLDLLLDASMSRMKTQETIAAQAYVIAKSFAAAHLPVRVMAFRSLRGYTVLQELKSADDPHCEHVLGFFSGGWNRDSLALRTMDHLLVDEQKSNPRRHILLVLTDAAPNDSAPLAAVDNSGPDQAPGARSTSSGLRRTQTFGTRTYEGAAAVSETAEAVRQLRAHGIITSAIFFGSSAHLDDLHQIYGESFVRIRRMEQIADATAELLKRSLESQLR